ncbi:MAG TPA: ABC transporter permease [Phycisphaerae bacterium]|nr:ABC transporter permease [Phycisphaerae bacterium]
MDCRLRAIGILMVMMLACVPCRAQDEMRADEEAVAAMGSRAAGSDGAMRAADYLAERLKAMTGADAQRQAFVMTVPVVEECRAEEAELKAGKWVATDRMIALSPLIPSGGQAAAIAPEWAKAELVYAGKGRLEDFRGKDLRHRAVALDVDCPATAWMNAGSLGASAIILLGDDHTGNTELLDKTTNVPIGLPRFYCDDAAETARIRSGDVKGISLHVHVCWEEKRVENVLSVLHGRQTAASRGGGTESEWAKQVVILQARYDAASLVMNRAPGAMAAANCALLLRIAGKIAEEPSHRRVVIAFTAGDEWDLRGSRELVDLLDRDARNAAAAVGDLRARADAAVERARAADETLAALRQMMNGDFSGLTMERAREAVEEELLRKSSAVEETLQRVRRAGGNAAASTGTIESRKQQILAARAFVHTRTSPVAAARTLIDEAAGESAARWEREAQRCHWWRDSLLAWPRIRAELGDRQPLLWLTLSLSSGSDHYGFFARSFMNEEMDATGPMSGFGQAIRRYVGAGGEGGAFQVDSLENRFTLQTFFPIPRAFSSDAAIARGQPAGALATVQDASTFLDTPNDLATRIDWDHFETQSSGVERLLLGDDTGSPGLLTDPRFYARAELPITADNQGVTVFDRTLGETLPRLHAEGALIGGEMEFNARPLPALVGTRRSDWHLADVDGHVTFLQAARAPRLRTRMQGFEFDAAGIPTRALAGNLADAGGGRGLVGDFEGNPDQPARAMLFDCLRLDAFGLFDPRYLDTLDRLDILDAHRLDAAEFSNVYTASAPAAFAAVFMPPDIRWQLLAARGNVSNRMILINADERHPAGTGFGATDPADIGPLPYRAAMDFSFLNTQRQRQLERFGVSNDVVTELQSASAAARGEAQRAKAGLDYPQLFCATDALWSLQSQVYQNLIDTSNGIIKAVIFLLLGLIPFSYFVERLLVGSTNVYRQIAWFAGIFAAMTLALWFHPAFRISSAPLMILLAFLILILSSTVVYILWGKFEEEIARLRGAELSAHMTSLHRGAVFGAAVRLGLSNMRRRGARTTLTLITLILLTFTLLCFTSVREAVHLAPQLIPFPGNKVPAAGILIRQRGWRALPPETIGLARRIGSGDATGIIAQRYWYSSDRAERPWFIPVHSPNADASMYLNALVGLDPTESEFQAAPIESILPGFNRMKDTPDLCWLPTTVRDVLPNLNIGDKVTILGQPLTLAGFFTPSSLTRLRQLTTDPLTPIQPSAQLAGQTPTTDDSTSPETSYRFLAPQSVAILPAAIVQRLGGRLTSIMTRPGDSGKIDQIAEEFAKQSAFTVYVSDGTNVRALNASASFVPRDFGDVLITMLIGGVIVFNTMLGAVSERGREIHVYTSVGLAPSHVGMLFLAEAAALGTIGVVAGYIFGQGFATVLSWTHLLPDVALNYSSVSAIATMGMVLGVVMLSSLWPARAATRVAAPSLQRDWKLPKPVGDLLAVDLPFTVNESAARGVCAFVAEFLISTSQSGAGRFTADAVRALSQQTTQGPVRGLSARIWLAPYDLGVIQTMRLSIHPTDQHNVFDVHVEMTREAGNPGTWRRLNRPFLIDIRKQFLLWRNLSHDLMQDYIERSEQLFAGEQSKRPEP